MEDLSYIIGLGFSGSDVWRAIIISFFAAMLVRKQRKAWTMTFWALLVDRCIWPLLDMSFSGASEEAIGASFTAMMETFSMDLGLYVVRFAGLFVMINVFVQMRKRIHKPLMDKKAKALGKPVMGFSR